MLDSAKCLECFHGCMALCRERKERNANGHLADDIASDKTLLSTNMFEYFSYFCMKVYSVGTH